ncbi:MULTISPECIES: hypothetical protein [unclassified Endozoicomonas]|uniref:hypothetical protein n=1 Tax=unclassified Endozoicomonas TaxID=2644528 RepID=UPI003BB67F12
MKKILLTSSISIVLVGCGSPIDTVQEHYLQLDKTLTIEQAFNNREVCEDYSWNDTEDSKGREIVEYKCFIKDSGKIISKFIDYKKAFIADADEGKAKDEYQKKFNESNKPVDAYEVIRFTLNNEEIPVILYTGVVITGSHDENYKEIKVNEERLIKSAYDNKVKSFKDHPFGTSIMASSDMVFHKFLLTNYEKL